MEENNTPAESLELSANNALRVTSITGVTLMRVDDSVEIDGVPSRTVILRMIHAANNKKTNSWGTVYQSISDKVPGDPYVRPSYGVAMHALRAVDFRIEDNKVCCDIIVENDFFMGQFLLRTIAEGNEVGYCMAGTYFMGGEGRSGLICGGGPKLPPRFELENVHAYVSVPVPATQWYWSDYADLITEKTPSFKHIVDHGGIEPNTGLGGLNSAFLDAFSNYMDIRRFYLLNGSLYHDSRLSSQREMEAVEYHLSQLGDDENSHGISNLHDIDPADLIKKPPPLQDNTMLNDFQTLATNIGGVHGKEMFESGDVVVFGETDTDYWVFWYVGEGENNCEMWRVAKDLLKLVDLQEFIDGFIYEIRLNYSEWRNSHLSEHPIIVEIPMPIDAYFHTKSNLTPIMKRGASFDVAV